ncbi:hypothetical protein L5515_015682 [Caenorhabditis briggsae]|uniref:Uncharacterized protein n=1 Tax=Caenorhabditis briggsae TaxID=6238 RepID=A0AAE9ECD8_CAEBR|nr:hypothetical protein L5515_015682 [Caenorhabditis briggsae]
MDDGSVNPQYITVGIVFIILWYFFFSIRMTLADGRRIWPADAVFGANVIDAKTKEDSEDGGKNGTSEVNHFEIVVFPKANDEEQNEATDKTETVQSDSDESMETALGGPPGRIELVS